MVLAGELSGPVWTWCRSACITAKSRLWLARWATVHGAGELFRAVVCVCGLSAVPALQHAVCSTWLRLASSTLVRKDKDMQALCACDGGALWRAVCQAGLWRCR